MAKSSFTAILPSEFKKGTFRLALLNEIRKMGTEIKEDFARPTKTWEHKVSFKTSPTLAADEIGVTISTDDEIYIMVSGGTAGASQPILPVNAKVLTLPVTYNAKTQPGSLEASQGGPEGVIFVRAVYNPEGIEARHFERAVEDLWRPKVQERFQKAVEDAADKTGYSM